MGYNVMTRFLICMLALAGIILGIATGMMLSLI